MITITIPEIPPSNNQYIGRMNRWEYQAEKKRWADLVAVHSRAPLKPFERAVVTLAYYFPDNRRRDPDNYSGKFLLDSLVSAGFIVDDSFDCITLNTIKAGVDKENPRTVIRITNTEI